MKKMVLFTSVFLVSLTSFAQESANNTSSMKNEDTQRSEYIAQGATVGLAYDRISIEFKIKGTVVNKKSGVVSNIDSTGKSEKPLDATGIKFSYSTMPKIGLGANLGGSIQSINSSNSDGKKSLLLRAEGNLTIATESGNQSAVYGFGGLNFGHITEASNSVIETSGIGAQLGAGVSVNSNLSFELGIYVTRLAIKDSRQETSDYEVVYDKTQTYVLMTGPSLRATYNF